MEGIFVLVAAVAFVVVMVVANAQGKGREGALQQLARLLEGGHAAISDGFWSGLDGSLVTGELAGRRVRLRIEERTSGSGKNRRTDTYAVFQVRVPNAVTDFEIRPAGVLSRVGRWLGVVEDHKTGHEGLDDKFIIRAGRGGQRALRDAFRTGAMAGTVTRAFEQEGFAWLRLGQDSLSAERLISWGEFDAQRFMRQPRALDRVAALCERREVQVTVKDKARDVNVRVQRFGWTGGGREVLCPYCRDQVELAGGDVDTGGSCQTVHHAACLVEAGGCTIFGCEGSRAAGRARA